MSLSTFFFNRPVGDTRDLINESTHGQQLLKVTGTAGDAGVGSERLVPVDSGVRVPGLPATAARAFGPAASFHAGLVLPEMLILNEDSPVLTNSAPFKQSLVVNERQQVGHYIAR